MLSLVFWVTLIAGMAFLTIVADFPIWITGGVVLFVLVFWLAAGFDRKRDQR